MNKITQEHVTDILSRSEKIVGHEFGKTTVVTVKLPNGFVIVESSSCVDPANYDPVLGERTALWKVQSKIWELEGYRLQCELHELKGRHTTGDIEMIARIAHEINRAYCEALGDHTQLSWEDAPDWQRSSAMDGVAYHLQNTGVTPEQSHENWLMRKWTEGWVYGPVKDAEKKTHPCCVPYEQLPKSQQVKDYLFRAVVNLLAKH